VVAEPGTRRRTRLELNVVADAVELSGEDLAAPEAAMPKGAVSGDRYPDMSLIGK